ncbi:MAG: hypothetical protein M1834_005786 [Cirrosporium novae-zelandiae]|nr:MAG: hypothetical protein M1834_005786 [Cirrosporium novae-zelandiae]
MKEILNRAHTTPKAIGLPEVNVKKTNVAKKEGAEPWALSHTLTGSTLFDLKDESIEPKKGEKGGTTQFIITKPHYFHYKKERDNYIVRSVGHPIDLKTTYPASSVTKYEIKIRKHQDPFLKRHTKLALKQHDTLELIVDAMKLGFIASAEIEGHALGHVLGGGLSENALRKFLEGVLAGQRNSEVGLAGDKM